MSPYYETIRRLAPDHDADHIECFIRVQHRTLDHLTAEEFRREVRIAQQCIDADPRLAKVLAASYGF